MATENTTYEGPQKLQTLSPDLMVELIAEGDMLLFLILQHDETVTCGPTGDITVRFDVDKEHEDRAIVFRAGPNMTFGPEGLRGHRAGPDAFLRHVDGTPLWVGVTLDRKTCIVVDRFDGTKRALGRFDYSVDYVVDGISRSFDPQINNEPSGGVVEGQKRCG